MPTADTTNHHRLPLMQQAQAAKHIVHNKALIALDARDQIIVDAIESDPPALQEAGRRYIIGAAPTAEWQDREGQLASWDGADWYFTVPGTGWLAFDKASNAFIVCDAGDGTNAPIWTVKGRRHPYFGIGTDTDTTNRLSVSSPTGLLP